ncbi:hypothetical protein LINGRAHAP2_LOCUS3893 [Linum grandiflorum]
MRNSTECRLWHHLLHLLGDLNLARPSPFSGDLCRDYLRRTSADSNSPSSSATTTNINCLENSNEKILFSGWKNFFLDRERDRIELEANNLHRSSKQSSSINQSRKRQNRSEEPESTVQPPNNRSLSDEWKINKVSLQADPDLR